MIRLHVLGSGSKGNAFAITSASGTLLIEAGFSTRSMVKRLEVAEVEPSSVRGIVLTHEHGDHARGGIALAVA
ncbi:MAG: MBL fold metallo-hydrolase, partial [Gemmatimonadota bacterium]